MSVDTSADEALEDARRHIREATKALSKIVIDKVWGHDEFREEWQKKIHTAFLNLIELGNELG